MKKILLNILVGLGLFLGSTSFVGAMEKNDDNEPTLKITLGQDKAVTVDVNAKTLNHFKNQYNNSKGSTSAESQQIDDEGWNLLGIQKNDAKASDYRTDINNAIKQVLPANDKNKWLHGEKNGKAADITSAMIDNCNKNVINNRQILQNNILQSTSIINKPLPSPKTKFVWSGIGFAGLSLLLSAACALTLLHLILQGIVTAKAIEKIVAWMKKSGFDVPQNFTQKVISIETKLRNAKWFNFLQKGNKLALTGFFIEIFVALGFGSAAALAFCLAMASVFIFNKTEKKRTLLFDKKTTASKKLIADQWQQQLYNEDCPIVTN